MEAYGLLEVTVVYVIQKSKLIRTKTIKRSDGYRAYKLCMSFKRVN